MTTIYSELQKFGLTNKEAKVYVALLELGPTPVSNLAKRAGINRSTAYVILEQLSKNGLVSISEKSGIKSYTAAPPERLVQLAESSIKKYTELISVGKKIQSELKSLSEGINIIKPRIQLFEGMEGVITAFEDTLTSHEPIRAYASIDELENNQFALYSTTYYKRRAAKNIPIKAFFPDSKLARERVKKDKEELRQSILVPKSEHAFTSEINIYDNKVAFMALREKFAFIIESAEISDGFKKMFDLAWDNKKKSIKN